jgi:enoyl-CoA hydratase/carnithine racemase
LNAIDAELRRELSQIFADVGGDRQVQAAVLTGKGRAFSAAGLRWFHTRPETSFS